MIRIKKFLSLLLVAVLSWPVLAEENNIAVSPDGQYVLRNVATGSYLMKDGTTTTDESLASNWRVITNDTIHYTDPEKLYYIHSDETIMQLNNSGLGWSVKFSPKANTTYVMPSETTEGAFKFRYRYLADTRFLNVEVNGEGNERLTAARTSSIYNDWEFVPTSHPKDYRYRLMSMKRSSGNTKYSIAYRSHDTRGNEVWLSGWMAVPTSSEGGASTADHVLFSAHFTITKTTEWPSASDPMDGLSFNFSTNKPVMIEPDYYGCGITEQFDHPYCAADIMAEECVDMLVIAHDLLRDLHQMDCSSGDYPTYGIGTSQGGSIILACQRYVENSPKISEAERKAINWVRTCACDGPYNPLATLFHYLYVDKLSIPSVAPLLLIGMVAAHPDIFGDTKAEEYFSDAFLQAGIMEKIRSRQYNNDELADFIKKACGSTMSSMLSEEAKDMNSDIAQKFQKALGQSNLTRDWSPKADIVLYYYSNDDVVPHLNFASFYNSMKDRCQGKLETKRVVLGVSHIAACVDFFARMILGAYKN